VPRKWMFRGFIRILPWRPRILMGGGNRE